MAKLEWLKLRNAAVGVRSIFSVSTVNKSRMLNKPFDLINISDIEFLVSNSVPESKVLEYKESLPGNTDDDKREFLADVSSFANASGGVLIYGIREQRDDAGKTTGLPDSIVGLGEINIDVEIRRLDSLLQSSLSPRIIGLQIRLIGERLSNGVLLIQIPLSWNAPHMVTFRKNSRFFSRNNAGKYQLDVEELRNAFISSEALKTEIQQFRIERISKLVSEEGPTTLPTGPKLMLHLIPIATFRSSEQIDMRAVSRIGRPVPPGRASGWNPRFNLDGLLSLAEIDREKNKSYSYAQLFRNGSIEAVSSLARSDQELIIGSYYEQVVLEDLREYIQLLQELAINPPIIIFLTLINVKGYTIGDNMLSLYPFNRRAIDRDILTIPESSLEDYSLLLADVMRFSFDVIWQASGYEGSPNYDESGKWKK